MIFSKFGKQFVEQISRSRNICKVFKGEPWFSFGALQIFCLRTIACKETCSDASTSTFLYAKLYMQHQYFQFLYGKKICCTFCLQMKKCLLIKLQHQCEDYNYRAVLRQIICKFPYFPTESVYEYLGFSLFYSDFNS